MSNLSQHLVIGGVCVAILTAVLDSAFHRRDRRWLLTELVFIAAVTGGLYAVALNPQFLAEGVESVPTGRLSMRDIMVGVLAGVVVVLVVLIARALRSDTPPRVELSCARVQCWRGGKPGLARPLTVHDGLATDQRERIMLAARALPTTPSLAWTAFDVFDNGRPFVALRKWTPNGTKLIVRPESPLTEPVSVAIALIHERIASNRIMTLHELTDSDVAGLARETFDRAIEELGIQLPRPEFDARLDGPAWVVSWDLSGQDSNSAGESAQSVLRRERTALLRLMNRDLSARRLPMKVVLALSIRERKDGAGSATSGGGSSQ